LDGLVWDRLAERGAVPDTTLCAARSWWNGVFWAVHPAREGAAGTNFVNCGDATLVQVWTDTTIARLTALAAAPGLPDTIQGLLTASGSPASGEVIDDTGVTWRLRRPNGRPAIPVMGVNGPLDQYASQVAEVVVETLIGADAATARIIVPSDDIAVATVVVAHELIWDITEALVTSGTVEPARSLTTAQAADEALVDLLFVQVNGAKST
jgi:hypothetical protein